MTEPRSRYSGRRSPTSNPARASMPVGVGYNPHFSGDLHAVPTARYDAAAPRGRTNEYKTPSTSNPPTTTITTYNVTKEPQRTSNTARRRSSTVDSGAVKPIIVTTNHATRPHGNSSHTSSAARQTSPSRDPYRSSDETYYTQPASTSSRAQRYSHGYSQSATLSNDELRRLRERVGDDRLRAPTHTPTDYYRYALPHASYAAPTHDISGTAVIDYENEGYEYTKPSDLARYDLDHDRQHQHQQRKNRRDSVDRPYYRPTVNVVSNDPVRYDGRGRGPPPTSTGLERYNRAAAAGTYDRPTVTLPALPPPVPVAPPVDPLRRIEAPREPSPDRRAARPRPVSLYQDTPARMSHAEDPYRSHDDERVHRRRERDTGYLDENVPARGFGIRTDSLKVEQPDRPARSVDRRDYDDRRVRREAADREPRRRSDESIDYARSHDTRHSIDDTVSRVDSRDSRDTVSRKGSLGGRARDKVATGLGVAAAAVGLIPKIAAQDDDRKASPRRRDPDEDKDDVGSSRATDKYKPRERDIVERSERDFAPRDGEVSVERRESRRERADSTSASRDREAERERVRERALDREREREREERDRDGERDVDQRDRSREQGRERDHNRRDAEAALNGSAVVDEKDSSPAPDNTNGPPRRRLHPGTFDPTDTRDLLDVKAELAAKDSQDKPNDKSPAREQTSERETNASASTERQSSESRDESRGREVASTASNSEKQVRVLSPPREKSDQKPIKGILKAPKVKFPEDENPIREGVAPHKDDKSKKGVPPGARWTKINRKLINPAALDIGKERYEVRDDFVIVLRVLNKEEIQAYATATAQIRAAKRKELGQDAGSERDHDRSDEERRTRRHHHNYEDDYEYQRDDRDRIPHRRHIRGSDSDDDTRGRRAIEYDPSASSSRHDVRHHRERDYDSATTGSDKRR
ncbi:hypothetical protein F4804DRAFT_332210 [Jackrogersella minutella]|nr:hypothetical protein F4804DRAFT_332210 [Jackrogersella minutella]